MFSMFSMWSGKKNPLNIPRISTDLTTASHVAQSSQQGVSTIEVRLGTLRVCVCVFFPSPKRARVGLWFGRNVPQCTLMATCVLSVLRMFRGEGWRGYRVPRRIE